MRARRIGLATFVALLAVATSISGTPAAAKSAKSAETAVRLTALDGSVQAQSRITDGKTVVSSPSVESVALRLNEPLQLRVVEPGGKRVALATPLAAGADTYRPGGRASTRLVVADLSTGAHRAYNLPRNVEPEAFGVGPSRATCSSWSTTAPRSTRRRTASAPSTSSMARSRDCSARPRHHSTLT